MKIAVSPPLCAPPPRAAVAVARATEPQDVFSPQGPVVPEWQQPLRPLAMRTLFSCHPGGIDLRHYAIGAFTAVRAGQALYHLGQSLRAVPAEAHKLRLKASAEGSAALAMASVMAGLAPVVVGIGVTRSSFVVLRSFKGSAPHQD